MTDEAMSPLRRRMIEDMTEVIAEDPARLHPHDQESGSFPRAVTRHGELRGHTMLSAASGFERRRHTNSQSNRGGAAVLFQGDAQATRHHRATSPSALAFCLTSSSSLHRQAHRGGSAVFGGAKQGDLKWRTASDADNAVSR